MKRRILIAGAAIGVILVLAGVTFLLAKSNKLSQGDRSSQPKGLSYAIENQDEDIQLKPPAGGETSRERSGLRASSRNISPEQVEKLVALGADKDSLWRFSDSHYVRDNRHVYWIFPHPRVAEDADLDSFRWLDGIFAFDKDNLYITGIKAPGVDPTTFAAISKNYFTDSYFKDKDSVYFMESVEVMNDYRYKLTKITGADPGNIRRVGNKVLADDVHVYLSGKEAVGLDGKTLKVIESPYFVDRSGTYFFDEKQGKVFPLSSSAQVSILTIDSSGGGYVKIGNQVLFGSTTIPGAHTSSFHVFEADTYEDENAEPCRIASECPYAADDANVYYLGEGIKDADAQTFTPIGYGILKGRYSNARQPRHARDQRAVYYRGEVVQGADSKTFTPLISGGYYFEYGRDEKSTYWETKLIAGADPSTFTIFEGQQPYEGCSAGRYSKDATSVYYQNKKIEGADPKTFKVKHGSGAFGEDANYFYREGNRANRNEFRVCDYG